MRITQENFNKYKDIVKKLNYLSSDKITLFFPCDLQVEHRNEFGMASVKYQTQHRYDSTLIAGLTFKHTKTQESNISNNDELYIPQYTYDAVFGYIPECFVYTGNLAELFYVYGTGTLSEEEVSEICDVECCFAKTNELITFANI